MSFDVQSELNPQARAAGIEPQTGAVYAHVESMLLVFASGLAAIVVSAIWVALSLA